MKKTLLILCFFISFTAIAAAQADIVINVDSLPGLGLKLDKGWKFHAGDSSAFARGDYDDHNWQSIDPLQFGPNLPVAARNGMGWLRLHFRVADSLRDKIFYEAFQTTAAEIYLNGKLIARRGTIDTKSTSGHGYINFDPINLSFTNDSVQVLAVRYAYQTDLQYFNPGIERSLFDSIFRNAQQTRAWDLRINNYKLWQAVCMSVLILLALLHLVFLYFNRAKKANLYFACYAFSYAISLFSSFDAINHSMHTDLNLFLNVITKIMVFEGTLFAVAALYLLFDFKPGRFFHWLIGLTNVGILMATFNNKFNGISYYVVALLVNATVLWLAIKAVYRKKRGAGIIAAGFLGSIIGGFATIYLDVNIGYDVPIFWELMPIAFTVLNLSPVLGMSLFLSREFALDSQLLAVKLAQVEQLSAANLAQEQEKQQLLANQNIILERQVEERTAELNQSLNDLKSTQTQLVQREKMASLGELTAGIAHEIQNPLNFVNNFSEVNTEMLEELKAESTKPKAERDDQLEIGLINDLIENERKINHHGKRADFIVKGMLEHSRTGTGEKQLTDLNVLCDEFMKLSYHGLRAKDKNFNAELVTNFDTGLLKINILQQNIGRVLLNLFNNAFYAVNQKQKSGAPGYIPEVSVTTFAPPSGGWGVKVRDNGTGIPGAIKEKIMQPFFTTKPTGEGTGLGLSLSYDIVVKGHGGSITVDTKEGEFTEFIVQLPIN